ncbi:uncharacterized protein EDB91DRAFT_1169384, partial [Suillus paluster]|uniref:uncharacterized protein n=1 Tax=Suillus paluster TaxID=48578 RepID=UPI001B86EF52
MPWCHHSFQLRRCVLLLLVLTVQGKPRVMYSKAGMWTVDSMNLDRELVAASHRYRNCGDISAKAIVLSRPFLSRGKSGCNTRTRCKKHLVES